MGHCWGFMWSGNMHSMEAEMTIILVISVVVMVCHPF